MPPMDRDRSSHAGASGAGPADTRLDDLQFIRARDPGNMLGVLEGFDRQVTEAYDIGLRVNLPPAPEVRNLVVCGMGGSAIGGDLLRAYLGSRLKIPLIVSRHYGVPGFVGPTTLAFLCSYSGDTEETLSAFEDARREGARVVCLSSNGELLNRGREAGYPCLEIPGGRPPRTAVGYLSMPVLAVLERWGLIPGRPREIEGCLEAVRRKLAEYGAASPAVRNPAKQLAEGLKGKIPIIYGSQDRLEAVAARWRAQICENAKQLAYFGALPEMNHNEIVGWKHPRASLRRLAPIFLRDREDHPRIQPRVEMTRKMLEEYCAVALEYWSEGESWLERLWSLILLGDYASVYLAILNDEDPSPVQAIDELKGRLRT